MKFHKRNLIKTAAMITPLVWKVCPVYFAAFIAVSIVPGLSHGVNTFVTAGLYNALLESLQSGEYRSLVICIFLLGGMTVLVQILNGLNNYMTYVWQSRARGALTADLMEKTGHIDPALYEDSRLLDSVEKAESGIESVLGFVFTESSVLTMYLPYFLFMSIYLYCLRPILVLVILLIFLPVLAGQIIKSKVYGSKEDAIASDRRKMKYYDSCICGKDYIKESRQLGAVPFFAVKYEEALHRFLYEDWKAAVKAGKTDFLTKGTAFIGYASVLVLLIDSVLKGYITVGEFAAVFSSISFMFSIMEEVIGGHLGSLAKNYSAVQNYLSCFELDEKKISVRTEERADGIRLEHVDFMYPAQKDKALSNINLTVPYGSRIAIVGSNGAGKSTLAKIILGIYQPVNGKVIFGRTAAGEEPRLSAVFQDYNRYKMSLKRNIIISDWKKQSDVKDAIEFADIDSESRSFPNGLDTMLSKEFGGEDLSGGQWQRVAIARGVFRNHHLLVLDEPTSAIDPLEENFFYEKLLGISKKVTVITVTHRLAAARLADQIWVMDQGKVLEIGNHKELMIKKGIYYQMWNSQVDVSQK